VVAHHAGAVQPGKAGAGALAETLGDPECRAALLRHADVEHAFGGVEVLEPALRLVIFALALSKVHDFHPFAFGKRLHRRGELSRHRRHQRGRSHLCPTMPLEERHHPASGLQARLVEVEIEPVDAFDVQPDMFVQRLGYRVSYHCSRHRLTFRRNAYLRHVRLQLECSHSSRSTGATRPKNRQSEAKPR